MTGFIVDDYQNEKHIQVQVQTLTNENHFYKEQLDKLNTDFQNLLTKVYEKK